jgi:hypothetical protein
MELDLESCSTMEELPVPLLSGGIKPVRRCFIRFSPWSGPKVEHTWNKSPLVEYAGRGPFAELALLGLLEEVGWEGVWVYRANKFTKAWHPIHGPVPQHIRRNHATCTREYPQGVKLSATDSP